MLCWVIVSDPHQCVHRDNVIMWCQEPIETFPTLPKWPQTEDCVCVCVSVNVLHYIGQVEGFLGVFWVDGVGRLSTRHTAQRFTDGTAQLLSWRFLEQTHTNNKRPKLKLSRWCKLVSIHCVFWLFLMKSQNPLAYKNCTFNIEIVCGKPRKSH